MSVAVEVTNNDIQNIVGKLPKSFGGVNRFEVVPLSDSLVGFWGDHFILKVYNDQLVKHDFFLKAVPRHIESRLEIIQETGFFEREMKIYEHFIPGLQVLSSISWSPKIYLAKEDYFIVLENLRDYHLYPSIINVWDYDHFVVATKTLAVFHASTVIYEEKFEPMSDDELKLLEEVAYPQKEGHIRYRGVQTAIATLQKLIKLIPKYQNSPKLADILKAFPEVVRKIFKFVESSKKFRNVLLHGDIWVNNVMFKYENSKPVEAKYIDFQFARYAPPAMDLVTFFYASSTVKFREKHLKDLLDIYCKTIENELKIHNIPTSALPRDEILKSFNEYKIAGLIEAALFNHTTLLPSDVATDMMNSSEEYEKFFQECRKAKCVKAFEESHYSDRMTEILSELIDDFIVPYL
ncbi:unnamed protein product [Chironomus riparius]|uniref:CHK kinase-like domain-containing protein n=1 Tax=Chironomus riparius TaxID=315576 RepID=A0A9N9RHS5_9DIPT|nr:unnamed protein product [Chironomus riparius]